MTGDFLVPPVTSTPLGFKVTAEQFSAAVEASIAREETKGVTFGFMYAHRSDSDSDENLAVRVRFKVLERWG